MTEILVRNRFSPRLAVTLECEEVGRTMKEYQKSCDIKYIIERYLKTGNKTILHQNPIYDDFSNVVDYQEALNIAIRAKEQFSQLPSKLRNQFENDPAKFLEFVETASDDDLRAVSLIPPLSPVVEPPVTPEPAE